MSKRTLPLLIVTAGLLVGCNKEESSSTTPPPAQNSTASTPSSGGGTEMKPAASDAKSSSDAMMTSAKPSGDAMMAGAKSSADNMMSSTKSSGDTSMTGTKTSTDNMMTTARSSAVDAKQGATDAMAALGAEAQKYFDQAMTYIKENKWDMADGSIKKLEEMKSKLPAEWQTKVENLRKTFNTAKAGLSDLKLPSLK